MYLAVAGLDAPAQFLGDRLNKRRPIPRLQWLSRQLHRRLLLLG
jgi:hypothetical protein